VGHEFAADIVPVGDGNGLFMFFSAASCSGIEIFNGR